MVKKTFEEWATEDRRITRKEYEKQKVDRIEEEKRRIAYRSECSEREHAEAMRIARQGCVCNGEQMCWTHAWYRDNP